MKWLELNAKLQKKKNALRKDLATRGILKRGAVNNFDKYSYFSEAQYKLLFTELFASAGLELKFTELAYTLIDGTEKQSFGRMPKIRFTLIDTETGFYEESEITGEGFDKGDKAGYKAYTGALKYYLANTFLVATGDDLETESPSNDNHPKAPKKPDPEADLKKAKTERKVSAAQIDIISKIYEGRIPEMLEHYKLEKIEDMSMTLASKIIASKARKEQEQ